MGMTKIFAWENMLKKNIGLQNREPLKKFIRVLKIL